MTDDEWVWLRNPATDGVQHVPPSAVKVWTDLGWEETDAPVEPNPALAEYRPLHAPAVPAREKKTKKTDLEPETSDDEKEMNVDA